MFQLLQDYLIPTDSVSDVHQGACLAPLKYVDISRGIIFIAQYFACVRRLNVQKEYLGPGRVPHDTSKFNHSSLDSFHARRIAMILLRGSSMTVHFHSWKALLVLPSWDEIVRLCDNSTRTLTIALST